MSSEFDEEDELTPRVERRGRPRIADEVRRSERVLLSFTKDEMRKLMVEAANAEGGPFEVRDWARSVILNLISPVAPVDAK